MTETAEEMLARNTREYHREESEREAKTLEVFNKVWPKIEGRVDEIGDILVARLGRCTVSEDGVGIGGVDERTSDALADLLTASVADILSWFLDAGSEREVTLEELGPVMRDHVRGWVMPQGGGNESGDNESGEEDKA